MTEAIPPAANIDPPVRVARWDSEIPLLVIVALSSLLLWVMLVVSIIGIAYAVFLGIFFFLAHIGFIAYLRGSAVRLSPEQLPELHARVVAISERLDLKVAPEAYLMQAGGSLNALATKLFSKNFIVLFSDLLEACGEDTEAADFIIAHEIGHLKAGHLRFRSFLILGRLVPFIGSAWSRACEYTADRYGFAAVSNGGSAIHGLAVLAAGGRYSKSVNLDAFVAQRGAMDTVMMTIGNWMASHPPLAFRIAELDQARFPKRTPAAAPVFGAIGLIVFAMLVPLAASVFFMQKIMKAAKAAAALPQATQHARQTEPEFVVADVAVARATARADIQKLAAAAEDYRTRTGQFPKDEGGLYAAYQLVNPGATAPLDPFDGERYGYAEYGDSFSLWSSGSDRPGLESELSYDSPKHLSPAPASATEAEGDHKSAKRE
ncbi:MAG: M48 family metalloprotease [Thermoanaerobaculia bacterium]|jgi:Zn-dependent protease with chaperone function